MASTHLVRPVAGPLRSSPWLRRDPLARAKHAPSWWTKAMLTRAQARTPAAFARLARFMGVSPDPVLVWLAGL